MKTAIENLVRRMTDGDDAVAKLCAETVSALEDGDVCRRLTPVETSLLEQTPCVVTFVQAQIPPDQVSTPFVVEDGLLYTRRNWLYERNVKTRLSLLVHEEDEVHLPDDAYYGSLRPDQRTAVETMCRRQFSILTGGPGTGKTHTIARAVRYVRDRQPNLRLGLAAPTGKAAARMKESMQKAMDDVPNAVTLHTLLGPNYDLVTFRHGVDNPLPLDWLIVDEASMIGLPMMSKLLDALPEGCRLTLVGDADQLASVERGHVFGDLCAREPERVCRLTESRRFPSDGVIARLAASVNGNRPDEALGILRQGDTLVSYQDTTGLPLRRFRGWPGFEALVRAKFAAFASARTPGDALAHLNDFRILCATRRDGFGVEILNRFVEEVLGASAPIPVMVTQNDPTLGVANGDVGVVLPQESGRLYLPVEGGGVRVLRLELLPGTEHAFASTIHKSQGSEFRDVAIVLPPTGENPLLTREILYTGITRTQGQVHVYAGDESIRRCCETVVQRVSGLAPRPAE